MHRIPAEAQVAALFSAALCTGVYFVTLGYTIRWLVFSDSGRKLRRQINKIMLSTCLAIFALSTVHLILAVRYTILAVRVNNTPLPEDVKTEWSATTMCTVVNITTLIVDAVLIYRCWITYSKRKVVVIFPGIFWMGGLACTILQVYWQVVLSADIEQAWQPVNMSIGPGTILTPFWSTTLVINIYATSMIVYKVWRTGNAVKSMTGSGSDQLSFTIRVLIESGALYLIVAIPHFIAWFTSSEGAIVFFSWINLPASGTAFNLIIIRIAKNRAEGKKDLYSSSTGGFTGTSVQITTTSLQRSDEGAEKSVKITLGEDSMSSATTQV